MLVHRVRSCSRVATRVYIASDEKTQILADRSIDRSTLTISDKRSRPNVLAAGIRRKSSWVCSLEYQLCRIAISIRWLGYARASSLALSRLSNSNVRRLKVHECRATRTSSLLVHHDVAAAHIPKRLKAKSKYSRRISGDSPSSPLIDEAMRTVLEYSPRYYRTRDCAERASFHGAHPILSRTRNSFNQSAQRQQQLP